MKFINPKFKECPEVERKLGMETVPEITLTNGGLFMSLSSSMASKLSLVGTAAGGHPNPHCISHCGLIFLERPSKILSIIDGKVSGRIPSDYPVNTALLESVKEIIEQEYPSGSGREQIAAFGFAMDGIGIQGPGGGLILPFSRYTNWKLSLLVRNVRSPYRRKFTRAFIRRTLGMPKELDSYWDSLVGGGAARLIRGMCGVGSDTYVPKMWCSELMARFYGLNHPCSIVPSQFASVAGDDAVIGSDLFESEIPLRISFDFRSYVRATGDLTKMVLFVAGLI
jgi:hypothetical protein